MHKKDKEAAGLYKRRMDKQGKAILDTKAKLKKWCNYIGDLLGDMRDGPITLSGGVNIITEEVITPGKAPRRD